MKTNKNNRNERRNTQWGNLTVIKTKRGILLVDSKNPDLKRIYPNEEFKKNNRKKAVQKHGA